MSNQMVRTWTLVLFFLVAWIIGLTAFAFAGDTRSRSFYSAGGSFAGSSVTRGNSASFYDGQGRFSGSSVRHGKSTSFYDGQGRYVGSSIRR